MSESNVTCSNGICKVHTSPEIWKDIPGYEGHYQVSNRGRVKSLERKVIRSGKKPVIIQERFLKFGRYKSNGRYFVNLSKKSKARGFSVHRLVLTAFVGPCPEGMESCHFPDGNRFHNCFENLIWGTTTDNANHRIIHGTSLRNRPKGERVWNARLTKVQVLEIRNRFETGDYTRHEDMAKEYGVSKGNIRHIKYGNSWKHLK